MTAILDTLLHAVYPPHCLACRAEVTTRDALCGPCWKDAAFLGGTVSDLCGAPLPGDADGHVVHCDECRSIARPWSKGRAALHYEGTGRRLVLALKHGDRTDLTDAAARWMLRAGRDIVTESTLIAPVPLHWWRLFRRRYNQSALLSGAIAAQTGLKHCPDLLHRVRATPTQDGRGRDARFENVARSMSVSPRRRAVLSGRDVLLVDDVLTSGATLAAAADACLAAGARDARVLALARVVKDA